MIGFRARKSPQNPVGTPLGSIAKALRLEIEADLGQRQADAAGAPCAEVALGLQAVGLLLQLEGIDLMLRAVPRALDAAARDTAQRLIDHD